MRENIIRKQTTALNRVPKGKVQVGFQWQPYIRTFKEIVNLTLKEISNVGNVGEPWKCLKPGGTSGSRPGGTKRGGRQSAAFRH